MHAPPLPEALSVATHTVEVWVIVEAGVVVNESENEVDTESVVCVSNRVWVGVVTQDIIRGEGGERGKV